jgi:thiol:disulfide interchange protein DsbA
MTAHKQPRRRPFLSAAFVCLAATLFAGAALGQDFDEGIDYRVIADPARAEPGEDVEVLELFWYGCPHCYHLEPSIKAWLETKPDGVSFRRMPAAASPRWVPHAKAYYAAEQLGVLDKLHEPLFKALHDERRRVLTDEQIIAFAAEQGIDEEKFRAAYNSFPVDMQVRKSGELVRRYNIDGVPAVVVNGKYVTSATQTGGNARMFQVIDYLAAKEAAAAADATQPAAPADDADAQPAEAGDAG